MKANEIVKLVAGRTNVAATGAGRVIEILSTLAWVIGLVMGVVG